MEDYLQEPFQARSNGQLLQNFSHSQSATRRLVQPDFPAVILTAAPKYQLNGQSEPRVVDSALSDDSQPQRKIVGKHVLQDGSISFRLGLELSFSDTIEVSADVILDHVSFDDLQSFEHAQFEAELAQKEKEEREYELAKGSKKCRGRPRKIRVNALSSTNDERQGLQGDVSDSDENSSESDSEEISGKNEVDSIHHSGIEVLNRQPIDRRQVHFNIEIPLSPFQQTRNHGIPRSATGDSKAKMRLDTKSEGRMASWKPTAKARGRPNLKKIPPSIHDLGAVKILPDTASEHSKADIRPNTKSEVSSRKPTARSRGRPKLQKIPPSIHDFGEVKILPGTVIENQINEELMTVASNSSLNKNRLSSASSTLNDSPIDEKNEDTRRSLSIMNNVFGPNFLKDQKGPFETRATASSFSRQKDGAEKELNLASKKPDRPISEGPKSTPLQTAFSKKIYNSDFSNLREKSPRRLPAQKSQKSAKNNNGKPGNDREVPAARSNKMIDDNMSDEDELGHTMFVADSEASEVGSDETNDLLQRFQNPHPKSKEPPHIPPSTSKNLPPIASSNLSPRKLSRPGTPSSFPPTSRPTLPLKPLPTPTSRISPSLPQKSPSQSDSDSDSNSKTVTENNLSEADLLLRSFQRKLPSHSLDPIASQLQSELAALPNPIHARSLPHKSRFESMTSPFPSGKSQPRHRQSVKSSSSLPRFEKNQRLHKRKRDQEIELEESDEAKTDEALIFEMDESFGLERKSLKAPTMKAEKQKIDKGVKEKKTAQAQFSATEGTPGTVRRLIKARMSRAEQQKIDEAEWKPRR